MNYRSQRCWRCVDSIAIGQVVPIPHRVGGTFCPARRSPTLGRQKGVLKVITVHLKNVTFPNKQFLMLNKWRRGGDSNPRYPKVYTISSRARSTGLCHLSDSRAKLAPHYRRFPGRRKDGYGRRLFLLTMPLLPEEALEERPTLLFTDPTRDVQAMIQTGIQGNIIQRSRGAGFGIKTAKDETFDPCIH